MRVCKRQNTVLLALALIVGSVSVVAQPAPLDGFDAYVNNSIKEWNVPGVAIAIVKDDKIVYAKGYGVKELGKPGKVTENTIFAIGSSSKAFTSAAIAMLGDEKKIKWDDRVTKYLPDFEVYDRYVTREMTVRDLLTHRIGLERGDLLWHSSPHSRKEVLRRIRYLEPASSVRSRFGYQNVMYLAAGEIVPVLTGKSWDAFITDRIFKPLRMNSSDTTIRTLKNFSDVATPHAEIDNKVTPIAWRNIDNIAPAGSINSNVIDVSQWVRLQLGKGKFEGKQLISSAAIQEMHASQTVIPLAGTMKLLYPEANFLNYGLGWFLSDYRGHKLVEHGGAIDGMRAQVAMIPSKNIGVVVLTNMSGSLVPTALGYRALDAYLGVEKRDWSADLLKSYAPLLAAAKAAQAKAEANRVKGTSPSLALGKYAGNYVSQMYGTVKVSVENGILKTTFGPHFNGKLEHWHYDTFRVKWKDPSHGKSLATFSLGSDGKVKRISLQGIADFDRLPEKPQAAAR